MLTGIVQPRSVVDAIEQRCQVYRSRHANTQRPRQHIVYDLWSDVALAPPLHHAGIDIHDPIFLHTGPEVEPALGAAIVRGRRWRKHFHGEDWDRSLLSAPTGQIELNIQQFNSGDYDGFSVRFKFEGGVKGQVRFRLSPPHRLIWVDGTASNIKIIILKGGAFELVHSSPWAIGEQHMVTVVLDGDQWVFHLDGREVTRLSSSGNKLDRFGIVSFKNRISCQEMLLRLKK